MKLTAEEKEIVSEYKLTPTCSLVHNYYDKDVDGKEVCQAIKYLRNLPNFVYGLFNRCNNNDLYGGAHYVLLRGFAETPYTHIMVCYHDRGPLFDGFGYPYIPTTAGCPLNNCTPTKILFQHTDSPCGDSENFRFFLDLMLKDVAEKKESKYFETYEEIELLCEAMDLNTEMKSFVEKEAEDLLSPKPNIDGFAGKEYILSEEQEEAWKNLTGRKKPKGWKQKKIS